MVKLYRKGLMCQHLNCIREVKTIFSEHLPLGEAPRTIFLCADHALFFMWYQVENRDRNGKMREVWNRGWKEQTPANDPKPFPRWD